MYWIKTPPAEEPITVGDVLSHLRLDSQDENEYLEGLIKTARQYVEGKLERALVSQTWIYARENWPTGDEIALPGGRCTALVGITYKDTLGASTSFSDAIADTDGPYGRVVLAYGKSWPSTTLYPVNPIQVEYVVGYGDAEDVPQTIKEAMYLLIGHWYANREAVTDKVPRQMEFAVEALLAPERVFYSESR